MLKSVPRTETIGSGRRRWTIRIRQAQNDAEMQERFRGRCAECGNLLDHDVVGGVEAFWYAQERSIWINREWSLQRKLEGIRHEMFHAMNDWLWMNYG